MPSCFLKWTPKTYTAHILLARITATESFTDTTGRRDELDGRTIYTPSATRPTLQNRDVPLPYRETSDIYRLRLLLKARPPRHPRTEHL